MKITLLTILSILPFWVVAQTSLGTEIQIYPAGFIPTLKSELSLNNDLQISGRLGYNITDRNDWGEHDEEEGGGFGFGIGVEKQKIFFNKITVQATADLWFMDIDWTTYILCEQSSASCGRGQLVESEVYGTSEIIVFQPTLGINYRLPTHSRLLIKPTISFGYEINIHTKGEEVGEGAILLGGIQIGYLFDAR